MHRKKFRNLDEQIDILKKKNLEVNNEEKVKDVLLKENYFFINAYRGLFYDEKKVFLKGTRFEELHALFLFDRDLRNILFKYLLVVENNIKSIFSYQLSKKYGYRESDYLDPNNFTKNAERRSQLNDVLRKMKRQIKVNTKQHNATMHYVNNYGYIPLWVLVKVLSFGIISEMFMILKREDQDKISDVYGFEVDVLTNYLAILANYRNLCAHEDIVFDHRTQRHINNTKYHEELNISKDEEDEYIYGKNDLFSLVIILRQMLEKKEFNKMIVELDEVISELFELVDTIPDRRMLDKIGFPENWKEIKNI